MKKRNDITFNTQNIICVGDYKMETLAHIHLTMMTLLKKMI